MAVAGDGVYNKRLLVELEDKLLDAHASRGGIQPVCEWPATALLRPVNEATSSSELIDMSFGAYDLPHVDGKPPSPIVVLMYNGSSQHIAGCTGAALPAPLLASSLPHICPRVVACQSGIHRLRRPASAA